METSTTRHRGNNFDFIRFVAASLVIITHSYALTGINSNDPLDSLTKGTIIFSHLGVAIFFTISGYLIANSLTTSTSYTNYLWKRCLRILPGLAIVLLLLVFVLGPIVTTLPLEAYFSSTQTYSALLTVMMYRLHLSLPGVFQENPNHAINGSLWTLSYEFTFYVLLLVIYATGLFRQRLIVLIGWLLVFALRGYLRDKIFWYDKSYSFLLGHCILYLVEWAMYFGAGVLFFLYKDRIRYNVWLFIAAFLILGAVICVSPACGRVACYICIPYIIFYLGFLPGPLRQFGRYGDFSYGMYIYAFPVQQTIIWYTHGHIGLLPMILSSFAMTLPFAVLSWHLVEKRALAFKNIKA